MKSKKRSNDWIQTTALFGIVFFGFYFVFSSLNSNEDASDDTVDVVGLEQKVDDAVNKSLRGAFTKKQLRDLEVKTNNIQISQKFKEKFKEKSKNWAPEQIQSTELYEGDASDSETSLSSSSLSVEAQLRNQIDEQKEVEDQKQRDIKEYIRQFKENAKQDGWIVELNDKLEVISAKPID